MALSRHQLSLDILNTTNESAFVIWDTSLYSDILSLDCPVLEITSPGFVYPVYITTVDGDDIGNGVTTTPLSFPGACLVLNACTLGVITTGCDADAPPLADGLYHIRYSVSPNDKVYVEYDHLRLTRFYNRLDSARCRTNLACCEPTSSQKAFLREIALIEQIAKAAKNYVEQCGRKDDGLCLYQFACKKLRDLENGCF